MTDITNLIFTQEEKIYTTQMLKMGSQANLVQLTDEERKQYSSINEKAKQLVARVMELHNSHPELCSPDIDWEVFYQNALMSLLLQKRIERLGKLISGLHNARILLDWNNYQTALVDYNYTQYKISSNAKEYFDKQQAITQLFKRKKVTVKGS